MFAEEFDGLQLYLSRVTSPRKKLALSARPVPTHLDKAAFIWGWGWG